MCRRMSWTWQGRNAPGNQGHLSTSPTARDESPTALLVSIDAQSFLIYGLSSWGLGARPGTSRAANDWTVLCNPT